MQTDLNMWDRFRYRMQKIANGKVSIMTVSIVLDRNGELECWTEPKYNTLEGAPVSLRALVSALKNTD